MFNIVSSFVIAVPSKATGASFTGLTVIVTVAMLLYACPSYALYVNESGPL